ncbi:MAG: Wzz/FepE/Etk N-terminal domain-containing protein, partial [Desulfuromonadales bacterium]|nr:Wzz/FepE/Etk N-terminal domain-containing protein [Desulfuromonadales bacterium]
MSEKKTFYPLVGVEKEVHLIDYINVVLRRWKIVLLMLVLVFCAVSLRTLLMQPIYEAEATLEVGGKKQNSLLEEIDIGRERSIETEIEKLRSRSLAETAIKHLNLHWQVGAVSEGLGFTVGEFVVNADLLGLRVELLDAGTYRVTDLNGKLLCKAHNHKLCNFPGGKILVDIEDGRGGQFIEFERVPVDILVEGFLRNLSIREVGKMTNVIKISYRDTDPVKARDIVNLLIDGYLDKNVTSRTLEAGKAAEFISQQLSGIKSKLDYSEQQLQEYKVQTGLITLGPEGRSLVEKMVALEQEQAELDLKRQRVEFAVNSLREAIRSESVFTPPTIEDIPQIADAANQLAELEAQKNGLLVDFTLAHPMVVEIQAQIRQVQETMLSNYKSIRQELLLRERDIVKTITGLEVQLEDIPEAELELAKRLRVNQVNSELYTFLLQKQQEAKIAQASTISDASVIDSALTPRVPVAPNKRKNLALGLILGIMLGVGTAFLLDYMDQTLKTTEDIREKLDLNVFGIIPRIPFADEDDKLPSKRLVTTLSPKSPVVESFRALRTNLNFATGKEKHKAIMITSSLPNEGKSTVTGNLAVVMAQTGAKVLLVGCDL